MFPSFSPICLTKTRKLFFVYNGLPVSTFNTLYHSNVTIFYMDTEYLNQFIKHQFIRSDNKKGNSFFFHLDIAKVTTHIY